jgi:hypothetical protein
MADEMISSSSKRTAGEGRKNEKATKDTMMRSRDDDEDDEEEEDDDDDEDLFEAASLATRKTTKKNVTNNNNNNTTTTKVKRKVVIDEVKPQSLLVGSLYTTENGSAFESVKTAFIVAAEAKYAAQLGSTHIIASSGGKNGLKINCFTDKKQDRREDCACTFGLRATWVSTMMCTSLTIYAHLTKIAVFRTVLFFSSDNNKQYCRSENSFCRANTFA